LSEALRQEVNDLGILVTAVEPGSFRTDLAGRLTNRTERTVREYDPVMNSMAQVLREHDGHQPGDPRKAGNSRSEDSGRTRPARAFATWAGCIESRKRSSSRAGVSSKRGRRLTVSTDFDPQR